MLARMCTSRRRAEASGTAYLDTQKIYTESDHGEEVADRKTVTFVLAIEPVYNHGFGHASDIADQRPSDIVASLRYQRPKKLPISKVKIIKVQLGGEEHVLTKFY